MTEQLSLFPSNWTLRYLAYCAENGRSPEEQMESDRIAWPGGCMIGFILWTQRKHS